MAKHEFGIMDAPPLPHHRYDEYEPWRYHCISVEDEAIEVLAERVRALPCFWHTLDWPETGLAYCGVTLIPPTSVPTLLAAAGTVAPCRTLAALLEKAAAEGKYVIHFGL